MASVSGWIEPGHPFSTRTSTHQTDSIRPIGGFLDKAWRWDLTCVTGYRGWTVGSNKGLESAAAGGLLTQDKLADLNRRYSKILIRYFLRCGALPDIAEDLAQDVFVRLSGRAAATPIENAEAYLMRTASSVWKDHGRRMKSRAHNAHVEYEDPRHGGEEISPDRVYEGREAINQVLEALKALDKRTRQVFFLRRFEGMSQKEVAKRLGISVSLVEKEMMKSIAHLADWLGDQ